MIGLSVAAALAGRRRGGAGLHRSGRGQLPAVRRPAAPAARGVGAGTGRARLGRSAPDPGPARDGDRPAVPPPVHPARNRLSAAPPGLLGAGAPAPRGRAQRGRDRPVAHPDLGEGTRLAASTGAWIVFEDEAGATLRPPKARTWAGRGRTPQVAVSGQGGRCRWPHWSATGPATAAGCSTESWCTAAAPASGAASPKTTTPRWSPPRTP